MIYKGNSSNKALRQKVLVTDIPEHHARLYVAGNTLQLV
jgi:hypothetical protein